jgi:hypothetical protein
MRRIGILLLLLVALTVPAKADFLLNCRLMTPDTKEIYRGHCKWETVVKCEPGEPCIIKRQNFISRYGNSALSANPQWLAAVSISNPNSGIGTVAGVSRPLGTAGAGAEILATGSDVARELSDALGNTTTAAAESLNTEQARVQSVP